MQKQVFVGGRVVQGLALLVLVLAISACQPRAQAEADIFDVVRDNEADRVGQYLAEGGDPNLADSQGDSLLYLATGARGGAEVASILLIGGADVNSGNINGRTALHNAAGWCNVAIVTLLIEAGADIGAVDGEGKSVKESVCAQPLDRRDQVLALLGA